MWSTQLKMTFNCLLILSAIIVASGQAQHYNTYNNQYAQQLVYQYDLPPQKTPPHQYLAPSTQTPFPPVQAQAPINLNSRQSQGLITQIVQGSEQFTFDMIYVGIPKPNKCHLRFENSKFRIIFCIP